MPVPMPGPSPSASPHRPHRPRRPRHPARLLPLLLLPLLAGLCLPAHAQDAAAAASPAPTPATAAPAADDAAALQQLRSTTLALIEALVQQGLLTRERADALLRASQASGAAASAAPTWGTPLKPADPAPAPVQRVPWISETVKAELREAVRLDVLEQARRDRWVSPQPLADWVRRTRLSGDLRLRAQSDLFDDNNLPADEYALQSLLGLNPAWSPDLSNTTHDRHRLTLRARLGVDVALTPETSAALRLSTGSTSSAPSSGTQTLGVSFNRLSLTLDRASLRWAHIDGWQALGGRMANPFFGTDLLWPEDLSLDGLALSRELLLAEGNSLFGTVGAFPLEEQALSSHDKWLYGLQLGTEWGLGERVRLRAGLGYYHFAGVAGVRESQPPPSGASAGTTTYRGTEYPRALRGKGNTLINLNDPDNNATPVWGLASRFQPLNLTLALQGSIGQAAPGSPALAWVASLDYVLNTGFDGADIRRRAADTGMGDIARRNRGLQLRLQLNRGRALDNAGEWQAFVALRQFERDAWLDGLTDGTWHGGGTGYRGWSLGGVWVLDAANLLGLRFTTTSNLDDRVTQADGLPTLSSAPFKLDVLQLDLSSRF